MKKFKIFTLAIFYFDFTSLEKNESDTHKKKKIMSSSWVFMTAYINICCYKMNTVDPR